MANAIPKAEWSEVEEYRSRLFYWEYLVNHWLSPGPGVLQDPEASPASSLAGPTPRSLEENRWLMEPESIHEQ